MPRQTMEVRLLWDLGGECGVGNLDKAILMGSEQSRPCAKGLGVGLDGEEDLDPVSLETS